MAKLKPKIKNNFAFYFNFLETRSLRRSKILNVTRSYFFSLQFNWKQYMLGTSAFALAMLDILCPLCPLCPLKYSSECVCSIYVLLVWVPHPRSTQDIYKHVILYIYIYIYHVAIYINIFRAILISSLHSNLLASLHFHSCN